MPIVSPSMPQPDPYDDASARPGNGRRVVSLYSGAGGLDDGFHRAGFTTVFANDFERDAVQTYNANLPAVAVHGSIDDESVKAKIAGLRDVDVVIGGPPCQGFSVAGHMKPD